MSAKINYEKLYSDLTRHFRKILNAAIGKEQGMTQTMVAGIMQKSQNAINNWMTVNKKYQCLPNVIDFLILCQVIGIAPDKFLDLSFSPAASRLPDKLEIPFIETSVTRGVNRILSNCMADYGISLLLTIEKNGTSRAIEEFCFNHPQQVLKISAPIDAKAVSSILGEQFGVPAPQTFLAENRVLLVFENADFMNQQLQENIVNQFFTRQPLVFVFKTRPLESYLFKMDVNRYYLKSITRPDLQKIAQVVFPGITAGAVRILETLARGRLNELIYYLRRILKKVKKRRSLTEQQILTALYNGNDI